MSDVAAEIQSALDALPNYPDQIAEFLREQELGPAGFSPNDCPIALYVRAQIGRDVSVGHTSIHADSDSLEPDIVRVYIPDHVRNFLHRYDNGKYRFLEHMQ